MDGSPEARMANEIAVQFHRLPQMQGAEAVAAHINRFWEPRMRARLLQHIAGSTSGLDPLVVAAAGLVR
ncbi:MAG TPA: formate dehydrogenase subunit delta [Pseudonocardiaceae bacterium]|nr:formate dehydrogenase subunit delta [Pseudonocardiaceae bacterium]